MFAEQRLYLTADKKRLVPEGDDEAATLYASPGDEIPDSAVERFGLVDGGLPAGRPVPASKKKGSTVKKNGENKGAKAGDTKETPATDNKAEGGVDGASAAGGTPPAETEGE